MATSSKLSFPKIRRIKLDHFSLYSLEPHIDIEIPSGVFCLAGANGLGKSTFLAAVNFGVTGIVPDPKREFRSVEEYYKQQRDVSSFTEDFFTGRIKEKDRDDAAITIHMQVNGSSYEFTRGVFEPNELRHLTITCLDSGEVLLDTQDLEGDERQHQYVIRLTEDIGIGSFDQFVFLLHFVLTFDESRHLLLWDQLALTQALYLSIGADFEMAQNADKLRRDMERLGSRARNYQFQAADVRKRMEVFRDALAATHSGTEISESEVNPEEVAERHRVLLDQVSKQGEKVESKRNQLRDADLKWAEASSNLAAQQAEYTREFSLHVHKRSRVELHPLVAATFSTVECALCGREGEEVVERVKSKIENNECPLCGSRLPEQSSDADCSGSRWR